MFQKFAKEAGGFPLSCPRKRAGRGAFQTRPYN
jgi:hypothetical protein